MTADDLIQKVKENAQAIRRIDQILRGAIGLETLRIGIGGENLVDFDAGEAAPALRLLLARRRQAQKELDRLNVDVPDLPLPEEVVGYGMGNWVGLIVQVQEEVSAE